MTRKKNYKRKKPKAAEQEASESTDHAITASTNNNAIIEKARAEEEAIIAKCSSVTGCAVSPYTAELLDGTLECPALSLNNPRHFYLSFLLLILLTRNTSDENAEIKPGYVIVSENTMEGYFSNLTDEFSSVLTYQFNIELFPKAEKKVCLKLLNILDNFNLTSILGLLSSCQAIFVKLGFSFDFIKNCIDRLNDKAKLSLICQLQNKKKPFDSLVFARKFLSIAEIKNLALTNDEDFSSLHSIIHNSLEHIDFNNSFDAGLVEEFEAFISLLASAATSKSRKIKTRQLLTYCIYLEKPEVLEKLFSSGLSVSPLEQTKHIVHLMLSIDHQENKEEFRKKLADMFALCCDRLKPGEANKRVDWSLFASEEKQRLEKEIYGAGNRRIFDSETCTITTTDRQALLPVSSELDEEDHSSPDNSNSPGSSDELAGNESDSSSDNSSRKLNTTPSAKQFEFVSLSTFINYKEHSLLTRLVYLCKYFFDSFECLLELLPSPLEILDSVEIIFESFSGDQREKALKVLERNLRKRKLIQDEHQDENIKTYSSFVERVLFCSSLLNDTSCLTFAIKLKKEHSLDFDISDPIRFVCGKKNIEHLKMLIEECDPEQTKMLALMRAIDSNFADGINYLLSQGIASSTHDKYGSTAFLFAARKGYENIVSDFISKGIDINQSHFSNGMNALHFAVRAQNLKIVKRLIEENIEVNLENRNGCTPLILAAVSHQNDIAEYLLDNGADISVLLDKDLLVKEYLKPYLSDLILQQCEAYHDVYHEKEALRLQELNKHTPYVSHTEIEDEDEPLHLIKHNGANCCLIFDDVAILNGISSKNKNKYQSAENLIEKGSVHDQFAKVENSHGVKPLTSGLKTKGDSQEYQYEVKDSSRYRLFGYRVTREEMLSLTDKEIPADASYGIYFDLLGDALHGPKSKTKMIRK